MKPDEIVCPECGKSIKKNTASIRNFIRGSGCPHCGTEIPELTIISKSKTIAVVLAIFFGVWSWLYTYREDRKKFWICLGLIALMPFVILVFIVLRYSHGIIIVYFLAPIIYVAGWVMALVDAARRPKSFFLDYTNGNKKSNTDFKKDI